MVLRGNRLFPPRHRQAHIWLLQAWGCRQGLTPLAQDTEKEEWWRGSRLVFHSCYCKTILMEPGQSPPLA